MKPRKPPFGALLITGLLLAALAVEAATRPTAADAEPYHARIRAAAQAFPYMIGEWAGQDTPVPQAAVTMLKPNVLLSRRYDNLRTGAHADVLLVQCRDARDMLGHYPPVCYAGSGWIENAAVATDWAAGERPVPGIQYQFTRVASERSDQILIANFLLLPDGSIVRDMQGIGSSAKHLKKRYYGAGQVQVIVPASTPPAQREEIFHTFITALAPVIDAISPNAIAPSATNPGGTRE